jgi:ABC-2 type transport system ATP-binding protein
LLIFDEPFSGFDPINVNLLKEEILKMKNKGATIIFSTHNMASVEELCDHITLINESETILQGDILEIKEKYRANRYMVTYDGDPEKLSGGLKHTFRLEKTEENGMGKQAIVQVHGDGGSGELIRNLADLVEIKSFQEILPSMNDIFIQVVQNASKKN